MRRRPVLIVVLLSALTLGQAACSDTPANDFEAGECTNNDLSGTVGEIDTVDCSDDHTAEAFAQFDLEDGDYPGDAAVESQASEGCLGNRFEDYVGLSYDQSIYLATALKPSEQSWNDADDRTVICLINGTTDGSALDGSAKDSNQ